MATQKGLQSLLLVAVIATEMVSGMSMPPIAAQKRYIDSINGGEQLVDPNLPSYYYKRPLLGTKRVGTRYIAPLGSGAFRLPSSPRSAGQSSEYLDDIKSQEALDKAIGLYLSTKYGSKANDVETRMSDEYGKEVSVTLGGGGEKRQSGRLEGSDESRWASYVANSDPWYDELKRSFDGIDTDKRQSSLTEGLGVGQHRLKDSKRFDALDMAKKFDALDMAKKFDALDMAKKFDALDMAKKLDALDMAKKFDALDLAKKLDALDMRKKFDALDMRKKFDALDMSKKFDALDMAKKLDALDMAKKFDALDMAKKLDALDMRKKFDALDMRKKFDALDIGKKFDALDIAKKFDALDMAKKFDALDMAKKFDALDMAKKFDTLDMRKKLDALDMAKKLQAIYAVSSFDSIDPRKFERQSPYTEARNERLADYQSMGRLIDRVRREKAGTDESQKDEMATTQLDRKEGDGSQSVERLQALLDKLSQDAQKETTPKAEGSTQE